MRYNDYINFWITDKMQKVIKLLAVVALVAVPFVSTVKADSPVKCKIGAYGNLENCNPISPRAGLAGTEALLAAVALAGVGGSIVTVQKYVSAKLGA